MHMKRGFNIISRNYTSRVKRSLLKQDVSNIPVNEYPVSKRTDTRVYAWGLNATGALGILMPLKKHMEKYTEYVHHPSRLTFAENRDVLDIAAGYGFSAFVTQPRDGMMLFGSGLNTDAQIGFHQHQGKTNKPMHLIVYPVPINTLPVGVEIVKVAAGRAHMLALASDGTVYALGNNSYGQCGRKIIENEDYFKSAVVSCLKQVNGNDKVVNVNCGQDHSFFLTESGKLLSCGWSDDGQTGLGCYGNVERPKLVQGDIKNEKIVKVTGTSDTVLALNDQGEVFGWGNSEYGQLSVNETEPQINSPKHLEMTKGFGKIVDIASGGSFCMILNENGDVFIWGYGILGFGPKVNHTRKPTQIPPTLFGRNDFNPNTRVKSICAGLGHSGAINDIDDLYMWGRNKHGCLGLGHVKDQFFPLKVSVAAKVVKVRCGIDHTLTLCKAFM